MKKYWYNQGRLRNKELNRGSFALLVFTIARVMRGEFKVSYSQLTVMDKD